MNNFVTNEGHLDLKQRIITLLGASTELRFLVGFFYFSGIRELYESLKANTNTTLKVLVGMNVDKTIHGLIEYADTTIRTGNEKADHYLSSLSNSINSDEFDNQGFYEQVKFFIGMIEEDRLMIRKTFHPNHSKLYLFNLNESQIVRRNTFITGSSNLTSAGLVTQREFNVEISDYGFDKAEQYFEDLWSSAIKITENEVIKKRLIEVVEAETLVKEITPFEAYVHLMKLYLDSYSQKEIGDSLKSLMKKAGYREYKYQFDAIRQALSIIEQHDGVIIADVVGLGKTIIACAVGKLLRKRGIVICPPGLMGDDNKKSGWKMYLEQFGLPDWEVRSRGDLENTFNFVKGTNDIEVVIIDEAHSFRNQDTESYEQLKNICRGRQVILLTATPFNNKPSDILALLKLFITPQKSSISLDNDLERQFDDLEAVFKKLNFIKKNHRSADLRKKKKAIDEFKRLFNSEYVSLNLLNYKAKSIALSVRSILEPVTIRRNRLDLQNNPFYKEEVKSLSVVSDPLEWYFDLTEEQSKFYDTVVSDYFAHPRDGGRFTGAIYTPFVYEKGLNLNEEEENIESISSEDNRMLLSQSNLFGFMRRLLVKRFESSFGAFRQSIENFIEVYNTCKDFIERTNQFILDRDLIEKMQDFDPEDVERELLAYTEKLKSNIYPKNHRVYEVNEFSKRFEFLRDIESDISLFEEVLNRLEDLQLTDKDPKVLCLIEKIKNVISDPAQNDEPLRKVIVFSEYVDTVKYLEPILKASFKNRVLTIAGNLNKGNIGQLYSNFDASSKDQYNDFDVLLTTDKLSEGFNLNRAGMVINYDIPWNPVRVIQRLGRINRISKKVFNNLFIVNFFPTERGADIIRSKEIASDKMFMIHSVLGEDSKIFDNNESPTKAELFKQIQTNPDEFEQESFYTRVVNDFEEVKLKYPEVIDNLGKLPHRIKVAKKGEQNELLVFFKKIRLYIKMISTDQEKTPIPQASFEEVYDKIKCDYNEAPLDWNTDKFWSLYDSIRKEKTINLASSNPQDLRTKALTNLRFLKRLPSLSLSDYKEFLGLLEKDITTYGTLPDYTLRRISNFDDKALHDIAFLRDSLGKDYLVKEQSELKDFKKELIIAVENKK